MSEWFLDWFNHDYLQLYAQRNAQEAALQVSFILKHVQLPLEATILDLGCGAGRHAIEMASRGFHVVGVDSSTILIQQAIKIKRDHPNWDLTFLNQDLFALDLGHRFDLVMNMFTSFGYFAEDEKNAEIFKVVAKHLKKNGKFLFDYLNPKYAIEHLVPSEKVELKEKTVQITRKVENDKRIIKTIQFPHKTYQEKVSLYSRDQIEEMMQSYGLYPIKVWNNFEGEEWSEGGERQIFLCALKS
ncbi:MAG: class I SAM-dependent methyltransferase [Chlamydiales bacterium]